MLVKFLSSKLQVLSGNISGRSSPPSTSARLPLRSGGIKSRFAVGRASGRDDRSSPPASAYRAPGEATPPPSGRALPSTTLIRFVGCGGGRMPPPSGVAGFRRRGRRAPPPRVRGLSSGGRGLGSGSGEDSVWVLGFGEERTTAGGPKSPPQRPLSSPLRKSKIVQIQKKGQEIQKKRARTESIPLGFY